MRFTTIVNAFLALAVGITATNQIHFQNLDSTPKTIKFTANPNSIGQAPTTLRLPANGVATWATNFPWEGNYYSISDGQADIPGILGEVNFGSPNKVYYDVSAIVRSSDDLGVKQIWGAAGDPVSGCASFKTFCNNAYNLWDDVQTKATFSGTRELYCSVGQGASPVAVAAREASPVAAAAVAAVNVVRRHARDFVKSLA